MAFQNVNQPTLSSRMHVLPSNSGSFLNASEIMLKPYCFKGSEPRWFRRKSSSDEEKFLCINISSIVTILCKIDERRRMQNSYVVRYTYYVLRYTVPVVRSTPYVDCYTFHFIRYTLYVMQYTSQPFVFNTHTHTHTHARTIILYTYM